MTARLFSETVCALGEGPLWHPEEQALYWFDILGKQLHRRAGEEESSWEFDEHVSAAGWIDRGHLLIASESALSTFDTETGESSYLIGLESDNAVTRSNDGRADPWGGFWIGTMGKKAEPGAGAIYRYVDGALHKLFGKITISNSICFAPDASCAYFSDTVKRKILRVSLDSDGFPDGKPELFADLNPEELNPDGAVVDAAGNLWVAQWGAGRVACHDSSGRFVRAVDVPARQPTCPAFGGPDMQTMFVTSAEERTSNPSPGGGKTYAIELDVRGQKEHRILL